jgi:hypothetical protein
MKKIWQVLMAGVFLAGFCACATTQQETAIADKPGGIVAEVGIAKGTVEAVNYDARTFTVKDAEGDSHFIKAGPEMINFPQIKVGDEVIAKAAQSIAIFVDKPEGKPAASANQGGMVMLAPIGAKPGMVAVKVMEVTAIVQNINYDKRTVKLKGPDGKTITTKVDPSVKKFDNIKKGDMVYMQITEELAIGVETPKK